MGDVDQGDSSSRPIGVTARRQAPMRADFAPEAQPYRNNCVPLSRNCFTCRFVGAGRDAAMVTARGAFFRALSPLVP